MSIETIQQGVLDAASGNSDGWNDFTHKRLGSYQSPEEGLSDYIFLSGLKVPSGQIGNRVEGLLKKSVKYLATTPSLELIQKFLPHLTEEKGNGPMNNLLHGMVEYPLDLVSGEIKKEPYPSLDRVTQSALDLTLPLCGALGVNMQNPDGVALCRALSLAPHIHDLTDLLYRLRNKHEEPTKSALAGCWMIIDKAIQYFGTAESLSKRNMPRFDKTARFPDKDTSQPDMETQWNKLKRLIRVGMHEIDVKGIALKIQHKDSQVKNLLDIYVRLKILEAQNALEGQGLPPLGVSLKSITPDASLLIVKPEFEDEFNPSAQKEWVQKTIIDAVKETREHISQGKLKQPEVSAEQFANIMEYGTRDLDEASRVSLDRRRVSARSQIRALSQIRGDAVNLKDEESGLYQLGFDTMEFYAHEGGFVCNLKVMGTNFELFFDQNYTLQSMNGVPKEVISDNMREKLEMIAIEYVYAIRTTIDDGNTDEASLGNDEPVTEGHDEVEVEGERGRHYKRAHLRVLPRNQRALIDRVTETEDDVLESTLRLQELSGFEGDSIDALLDGFSWVLDPPNKTLQQKMDEMENKHAVLERIRDVDLQTIQCFGISLSDLNRLFRDAQRDPSVLNQEEQQVLHYKNYPDSVFDLVRHLMHRVPDRPDALGPAQVTFVREVHTDGGTSPREMRCPGASRNIRDILVPPIEQT